MTGVVRRVLYVTADGLLQPIGYSQVVRLVTGLAARGAAYDVLSLERADDLGDAARLARVRDALAAAGVGWRWQAFDTSGGGRAAAGNIARLVAATLRRVAARDVWLVHARSYHGAFAAWMARRALGVRYLFDARSYWIDERLVDGQFANPAARLAARALERRLYRDAAALVTLTELQSDDVRQGRFGRWTGAPTLAVPTCADYDAFRLRDAAARATLPAEVRARLDGRRVIGLIGSINSSYYAVESARLARHVVDLDPEAHVLALGAQTAEYAALLAGAGVPPARYTLARAANADMPAWLAATDWCLQLLRENFAKRASVPTKLAELFASGVRPLHYGCNAEVSDWVARAGSGLVLRSLDDAELRRAARVVVDTPRSDDTLARARAVTAPHFSLASGLDRYQALLRSLR